MKIEPIPSVNNTPESEPVKTSENSKKSDTTNSISTPVMDAETKQALDQATGLLQTIVTEKISDKVIRKMPSDEYLHLLSLLDEIISGSIDKHV